MNYWYVINLQYTETFLQETNDSVTGVLYCETSREI